MKSVGIIGGLGPETSAEFYLEVVFRCQKLNDQRRPLVVMSSVPLPFVIERDLIATNTDIERYIPFLVAEAQRLEKSDVDFIVMPCNSLHAFIDEIRNAVKIPVLSIVEETVKYLEQKGFRNVGLISTSATVANNVYETKLKESNIAFVTPNDLQRAKMDKVIQRLIDGQHMNQDRELIIQIVQELIDRGADCVALACTDLQLLLPKSDKVEVFDTMSVLADSTVRVILV
jgi:aspartate racemase